MVDWVTVAQADEIAPGAVKVVDLDGANVAIFNIDGEYLALEDVCSHDGGELASGKVDGDQIICASHCARFCLGTGEALCAPAYEPTAVFPVQMLGSAIQIKDERWD